MRGLFLLICVLLPAVQGNLLFLKNLQTNNVTGCYTSDTSAQYTVAFLREVGKPQSGKDYFLPTEEKVVSFIENGLDKKYSDCILPSKCSAWTTSGFKNKSNLENWNDEYGPILDERWNSLPETVSSTNFNFGKTAHMERRGKKGRFHFSALAKESVQVLLTAHEDWQNKSGFYNAFDGFKSNASKIRYYPRIPDTNYTYALGINDVLDDTIVKTNTPIFNSGNNWATFTVDFEVDDNITKLLKFSVDDWSLQFNSSKYPNVAAETFKYYIFSAHNFYRSYFRVHKYWVLESENNSKARMTSKVELNEIATICMDIIALIKENGKFSVQAKSRGFEKNSQVSLMEKNVWKKERVEFENIPRGKYDITVEGNNFVIGQIKFCGSSKSDGYFITTNTNLSRTCNSLDPSKKGQLPAESKNNNYIEKLPTFNVTDHAREIICKELGNPECENIRACDVSGCFCFSGYSGSICTQRCTDGKFGPNCKTSVDSRQNCAGNGTHGNYSVHTGKCFSCAEGFRAPDCVDGIIVYPNFPTVTSIGKITTVNFSLAWEDKNVKKYFHRGLVQFREKSDQTWDNYTFEKTSLILNVTNLNFNTTYDVRIVLIERNGESHEKGAKIGNFSTPKCLPINFAESAVFENGSWRLTGDENLCKNFDCKLQYSEKNVSCNETDKRKNFTIFLKAEDGSSFTKYFSSQSSEENQIPITYILIVVVFVVVLILAVIFLAKFLLRKINTAQEEEPEYAIPLEIMDSKSTGTKELKHNLDENHEKVLIENYQEYFSTSIKSGLLSEQFWALIQGKTKSVNVGSSKENRKKNRDGVCPAYDETRICLKSKDVAGKNSNDYINANYVKACGNKYVATQGPIKSTVKDFWRMVWQEQASLIVMLVNVKGNWEANCAKYWPDKCQVINVGSLEIRNVEEDVSLDFVKRTLSVTNGSINRKITQMHFTAWPDHGIPFGPHTTAEFVENILKMVIFRPLIVHCSSGEGRTGAFILIDACLRMAKSEGHLNPYGVFKEIRRHRANLVENEQQYMFAHFVIHEALCVPKFGVPCKTAKTDISKLMGNDQELLMSQLKQLNEVCAKDWSRVEIRDSDCLQEKCRKPELQALPMRYVRLVTETMICNKNPFINAVYVDGFKRKNAFIATQVPLSDTVSDFWLMVYQQKVKSVILLNEAETNEPIFMPRKKSSPLTGEGLAICLQGKSVSNNYQVFTVDIEKENDSWVVDVVRFTGWPANLLTIPKPSKLIQLWEDVERNHAGEAPIVLMCHDGVTACGAFLALGLVIEKIKLEHEIDVASAVRAVRNVRPGFVSEKEQYELLYRCALEFISDFATYKNFY
ncbi:tyrosine-protein phosphatase 69D-like isoform X2 [Neocloeon triangulifer]|uniref:tyrosine-protein phosphatase 69D-like isoform X2 n=1 Tax=Neocloeon triangulifer TaxID=2078957 RepID=UPI00286F9FEF|nr:tyrosine-protein phosphatase 69D-like isoform X2 [Neocloeon triangulifer]